jgi:autoinducer 2-degrading protein
LNNFLGKDMIMHVTLVHVHVKSEYVNEFIEATRLNHEASVKEEENCRFDILQYPEDHGRFILYEAYQTPEGAIKHKDTLHYAIWKERVAVMMAEPREGIKYNCLFPK